MVTVTSATVVMTAVTPVTVSMVTVVVVTIVTSVITVATILSISKVYTSLGMYYIREHYGITSYVLSEGVLTRGECLKAFSCTCTVSTCRYL